MAVPSKTIGVTIRRGCAPLKGLSCMLSLTEGVVGCTWSLHVSQTHIETPTSDIEMGSQLSLFRCRLPAQVTATTDGRVGPRTVGVEVALIFAS
ncbi:hypothetical protein SeMB42_g00485 [Synchytrium endobioticum]|uniref:Uncharacterized protein n=1 Tax=Synchytrium endobioticum TaxID=286115 RepID=A0A507DQQ8_9FUNG|nr:hypothetical protein SeMB42_g00485 [Synchytrium endobioticum]